jgi:hypothetical protein
MFFCHRLPKTPFAPKSTSLTLNSVKSAPNISVEERHCRSIDLCCSSFDTYNPQSTIFFCFVATNDIFKVVVTKKFSMCLLRHLYRYLNIEITLAEGIVGTGKKDWSQLLPQFLTCCNSTTKATTLT